MAVLASTPKSDGFFMPAETDWHAGCWILWPERPDNWRLGAKPAQRVVAQIAQIISQFEPVTVCVNGDQYENARHTLAPNIRVIELSSNEAFIRDTGPSFIINGNKEMRGIDWTFNGYGGLAEGLYFPWDKDNLIAQKICQLLYLDNYQLREFVLEGCSFCVDGNGTMVVTEECLLSEGRNPKISQSAVETTLTEYLGVEKVIWLKRGLYMDEGKGHIDNLFSFIHPGEAMLSWTDDQSNPQYEIVREALDILQHTPDAKNRTIRTHKMPLPDPLIITKEEAEGINYSMHTVPRCAGDRMTASYLNCYLPNGALIYPQFNDKNDKYAHEVFSAIFPHRKIIGIYAREIFLNGGGIHSMVLQQPSLR